MDAYTNWKSGLATFLIAGITSITLCPSTLRSWAEQSDKLWVRNYTLPIASRFESALTYFRVSYPSSQLHHAFLSFNRNSHYVLISADRKLASTPTPSNIQDEITHVETTKEVKKELKVLMIGDSILKTILEAQLAADFQRTYGHVDTETFASIGTGLARPDLLDWIKKTKDLEQKGERDISIIFLGMNDTNPVSADGKKYYRFNTPGWKRVYFERVHTLLNQLCSYSRHVYWIEVLPVRDYPLKTNLLLLNRAIQSYLEAYSKERSRFTNSCVKFIASQDTFPPATEFTSFFNVDGKLIQVREKDGIHLTNRGASIFSKYLIDRIKDDLPKAPASIPSRGIE